MDSEKKLPTIIKVGLDNTISGLPDLLDLLRFSLYENSLKEKQMKRVGRKFSFNWNRKQKPLFTNKNMFTDLKFRSIVTLHKILLFALRKYWKWSKIF